MTTYFCTAFILLEEDEQKRKIYMEQKRKYKGFYWLLFFISAAALAFAIYSHWPWLTLLLPFVTTSFVKAMDIL